jgi:hypothetical protein
VGGHDGGLGALLRLDPDAVEDAGRRLCTAALGLATAADALGRERRGGGREWRGQAATAAWARLGERSAAAAGAATAFDDAGRALGAHARQLRAARERARVLLARLDAVDARAPGPLAASLGDPADERGAVLAAGRLVEEEVAASGATAAAVLRTAAAEAPPAPGWHGRLHEAVEGHLTSLVAGAAGAVFDLLSVPVALAGLTPVREAVDPEGHRAQHAEVRATLAAAAEDPGAALAALVDTAAWREDPARALGALLPDAAAVLVGAGGATRVLRAGSAVRQGAAASAVGRRGAGSAVPGEQGWEGDGLVLDPLQDAETRALRERAVAAEPGVSAGVGAVREQVGARALGMEHRVKGLDSLRRKVAEQLPESSLLQTVDGVRDALRFTVGIDDAHYAAGAVAVVRGLRAQGFVPVAVKNAWVLERPYRGLNTVWADPRSSVLFEVQVHTPASWEANLATHRAYEVERLSTASPAERAEARAFQEQVWSQVPSPPAVGGLGPAAAGLAPATAAAWAAAVAPAAAAESALLVPRVLGPPLPEPAAPARP